MDTREVTLADGASKSVPYVGPIRVGFEKRFCLEGETTSAQEISWAIKVCKRMKDITLKKRAERFIFPFLAAMRFDQCDIGIKENITRYYLMGERVTREKNGFFGFSRCE